MKEKWTPAGWRSLPAKHIPTDYPDPTALTRVEQQLRSYPPLVFAGEARKLKAELAQVAPGQPATGNITDIIAQVDRMSRWVSDFGKQRTPPSSIIRSRSWRR